MAHTETPYRLRGTLREAQVAEQYTASQCLCYEK